MKLIMRKSNLFGAIAISIMSYILPILFTVLGVYGVVSNHDPFSKWKTYFIIVFMMYIFSTWVSIWILSVLTGFLKITKEGLICTAPFKKKISYSWNEIVSCGMDSFVHTSITQNSSPIKMVYVSKKEVPSIDYHKNGRFNSLFWNTFLKKYNANLSIQKERSVLLLFEVYGNQLDEFKKYLPEHLLKQLEDSEKRLDSILNQ